MSKKQKEPKKPKIYDHIFFLSSRKLKDKEYDINAYLSDKFNTPIYFTEEQLEKIPGKNNWKSLQVHTYYVNKDFRLRIRVIEVYPYYRYLTYRDDVIRHSPFYTYAKYNRRKFPRELIDLILN